MGALRPSPEISVAERRTRPYFWNKRARRMRLVLGGCAPPCSQVRDRPWVTLLRFLDCHLPARLVGLLVPHVRWEHPVEELDLLHGSDRSAGLRERPHVSDDRLKVGQAE